MTRPKKCLNREEKHENKDEEQNKDASDEGNTGVAKSTSGILSLAREHLQAITGARCESITGFERSDDGWRIRGVVLEVSRIPPTTDILASFDLEMDGEGELLKCQRINRYWRSQAMSDDGAFGHE